MCVAHKLEVPANSTFQTLNKCYQYTTPFSCVSYLSYIQSEEKRSQQLIFFAMMIAESTLSHSFSTALQQVLQSLKLPFSITYNSSWWMLRKTPMHFQWVAKLGVIVSSNSQRLGCDVWWLLKNDRCLHAILKTFWNGNLIINFAWPYLGFAQPCCFLWRWNSIWGFETHW